MKSSSQHEKARRFETDIIRALEGRLSDANRSQNGVRYRERHRDSIRAYNRTWQRSDKRKRYKRLWAARNRERRRAQVRRSYHRHGDRRRAESRERDAIRRAVDVRFRAQRFERAIIATLEGK